MSIIEYLLQILKYGEKEVETPSQDNETCKYPLLNIT
jgi:hypothetical protein